MTEQQQAHAFTGSSNLAEAPTLNVGVDAATPLVRAAMPSAGAAKPTSIG